MDSRQTFFWLIALALWGCSSSALAQRVPLDTQKGREVLVSAENQSRSGRFAVSLRRLGDSLDLLSYRASEPFVPASILKTLSTGAALSERGRNYSFRTKIYFAKGKPSGETLRSDIIIKGSGDPSIGSTYLPEESGRFEQELAEVFAEQGIREIEGNIIVDASAMPEAGQHPSWLAEDLSWYYGAGIFGFNYADNAIDIGAIRPRGGGKRPRLQLPDRTGVVWHNSLRTGKGESVKLFYPHHGRAVTLSGTIPSGKSVYRLRLYNPKPSYQMLSRLRERLQQAGISWRGKDSVSYSPVALSEAELAHTYYSPTLDVLAQITNHKSHNLFAEALASLVADAQGRGAGLQAYWLRRLGMHHHGSIHLVDGSGLSRGNRVTARFMTQALYQMLGAVPEESALLSSLPRVGVSGTVRSIMSESEIEAYLKSGYMKGVVCYAGYVRYAGEWYVVTIMSNDFASTQSARQTIVRFLRTMFPASSEANTANN